MPDAFSPTTSLIIGRALLSAESIAAELRQRLADVLSGVRLTTTNELIDLARRILSDFEPFLAENLLATDLAAWIAGYDLLANQMPEWALELVGAGRFGGPPEAPKFPALIPGDDGLRFPLLEEAAKSLTERGILTREAFDQQEADARARSFTIAGDLSEDTIAAIRNVLVEDIDEGTSLGTFRQRVEAALGGSPIGPHHLETVYRTNVQAAFRDGRETLARNPIVDEIFPYQAYHAVHDGRVRSHHLALESLGLDGTNVYRRDDTEFWDAWTPPNGFQCFVPETVVQGKFNLGLKSWYAGEFVEITTASGNRLTVTANHPVCTAFGFKPAHCIRKGDTALRYIGRNEGGLRGIPLQHASRSGVPHATGRSAVLPSVEHDQKYKPSRIDEVFEFIATASGVRRNAASRRNDLHGDAKFGNGNIEIVGSHGELLLSGEANGAKCGENISLAAMHADQVLVSSFGGRDLLRDGPSSSSPSDASFGGRLHGSTAIVLPVVSYRFGHASDVDASPFKSASQGGVANAYLLRQLVARLASVVAFDEVVKVRNYKSAGHVYDLQSDEGIIVANGLLASNCRCSVTLLTIDGAARAGVGEAREWLRTSQRPPLKSRMPFIPFQNEPGFGHRTGRAVAMSLSRACVSGGYVVRMGAR